MRGISRLTEELLASVERLCSKELVFLLWGCGPTRARATSFLRSLDHTQHTTIGRTPLDKRSARRRDSHLTSQHSQQTSMTSARIEPTVSSGGRPQTYVLDCAATATSKELVNEIVSLVSTQHDETVSVATRFSSVKLFRACEGV
jgi:hypothetical protein